MSEIYFSFFERHLLMDDETIGRNYVDGGGGG